MVEEYGVILNEKKGKRIWKKALINYSKGKQGTLFPLSYLKPLNQTPPRY